MSKQRMKLHMKVLGQTGVSPAQQKLREDKPAYKEKFVPPEVSVLSYLMTKVLIEWHCISFKQFYKNKRKCF